MPYKIIQLTSSTNIYYNKRKENKPAMYNITQEQPILNLPHNYAYKNKIYILDEITVENTSRLLADISEMIEYERCHSLMIEWYINSPGGEVDACKSLLSMMKIANLQGIENSTYVLGNAASSASILAISGNTRYIMSYGSHYIHYGNSTKFSAHPIEAKRNYKDDQIFYDWVKSMYLEKTEIPEDKLDALIEHEGGFLYPKDCLKYKFVEYIID